MSPNTSRCNRLTPLRFKGLMKLVEVNSNYYDVVGVSQNADVCGHVEQFGGDGCSSWREETTTRQHPDIKFDVSGAATVRELLRQLVCERGVGRSSVGAPVDPR